MFRGFLIVLISVCFRVLRLFFWCCYGFLGFRVLGLLGFFGVLGFLGLGFVRD